MNVPSLSRLDRFNKQGSSPFLVPGLGWNSQHTFIFFPSLIMQLFVMKRRRQFIAKKVVSRTFWPYAPLWLWDDLTCRINHVVVLLQRHCITSSLFSPFQHGHDVDVFKNYLKSSRHDECDSRGLFFLINCRSKPSFWDTGLITAGPTSSLVSTFLRVCFDITIFSIITARYI